MTRATATALTFVLAALAAVQHVGLERQPETIAENKLKNLPDVGAGDMLPTYVASLFFGAFRAVAIDVLWIQLKKAEDERRWYERRDILKMISYVQPRNPEVWSHLGWHSAYNVANGFTDEKKSWDWVRFGLTWLRQGIRMIPDSPHLKFELAYTLLHKPSWREAEMALPLLRKIETDADLQRDLLPDDVQAGGKPLSAFDLARLWLERAKADIRRRGVKPHKTQMGLYIYLSTLDGYIRRALYLNGMRSWQEGDHAAAIEHIRAAAKHVQLMLTTDYPEGLSSIFKDWAAFYAALPEVVELHARYKRSRTREDDLGTLKVLQELVATKDQALDEGFLWSRSHPGALLNAIKIRLVGAADSLECNDGPAQGVEWPEGKLAAANIAPAGLDVDWYWLRTDAPAKGEGTPLKPPAPLKMRLQFGRPAAARMDLRATLYDTQRREIKTAEIRGKAEIEALLPEYGTYFLKVEPLDPHAPPPPDTRYFFQYAVSE